jgi:hypothetical protein
LTNQREGADRQSVSLVGKMGIFLHTQQDYTNDTNDTRDPHTLKYLWVIVEHRRGEVWAGDVFRPPPVSLRFEPASADQAVVV